MKGLRTIRKKFIALCVLSCSVVNITLAGVGIAFAGGGGLSGGATEMTQLANKAELIEQVRKATEQINNQITQITNQITMIQDMVYNTLTIPDQLFRSVKQIYSKVNGVIGKTKGVAYNLANIDEEMKRRFKSYGDMSGFSRVSDFSSEYRNIVGTQMETVRTTMEAIGVSMQELARDDASALEELQRKASSAKGRNELIQATNQLLGFMADDAMKLRQLQMMQAQMTGVALEAERAKEDLADKRVEAFFKRGNEEEVYVPEGGLLDVFDKPENY